MKQEANRMHDGVHIRLTLTRGIKLTSGMDPRLNRSGPTLIVLAEHKAPVYARTGITLITSSVRRPPPENVLTKEFARASAARQKGEYSKHSNGNHVYQYNGQCTWHDTVHEINERDQRVGQQRSHEQDEDGVDHKADKPDQNADKEHYDQNNA